MPKEKIKPRPVAPIPPEPLVVLPTTNQDNLPVIHNKLTITEFSTNSCVTFNIDEIVEFLGGSMDTTLTIREIVDILKVRTRGPLTIDEMKLILGWETEKQYQERRVAEDTAKGKENCKSEHYLYGDDFHCRMLPTNNAAGKAVDGDKVRCTNNLNNRPFDAKWCEDLMHTVLYGQWAGPYTIPGETVNGETIRISKYGRTISGQHQMTAAILADQCLLRDRKSGLDHPDAPKYPAWRTHGHVFLETLIVTGMSEDPRVLMTVDYVKPRTVADVFYTSPVFKDSSRQDRQELCRVLDRACDFLWTRTDAHGYRTHLEIVGFLERHPRLLDCVMHLFKLNRATKVGGRKVSNLRLSPGQCASVMYIMGSAGEKTDGDEYRNMAPAPSEKNDWSTGGRGGQGKDALDWSYWDKAVEFFNHLTSQMFTPTGIAVSDPLDMTFAPVKKALGQLVTSSMDSDDNLGMGGRLNEKLAVLAKAWERWKDHPDNAGPPFEDSDLGSDGCLFLTYVDYGPNGKQLPDGQIELVDLADFYGIDCPQVKKSTKDSTSGKADPPVQYTKDEMEKMKEDAQARRQTGKK